MKWNNTTHKSQYRRISRILNYANESTLAKYRFFNSLNCHKLWELNQFFLAYTTITHVVSYKQENYSLMGRTFILNPVKVRES